MLEINKCPEVDFDETTYRQNLYMNLHIVWLQTGRPAFDLRQKQRIFPLVKCQTSSEAQPASFPVGVVDAFPGGKSRPGCDADHSPPYTVVIKNK
jgi:hypothetical protein